ncbi:hypothetical protein DL96DRAFT_852570 [Flagelloscypha sp. PMI_526]|nr:hypothetical protein DL96DRAFT_852570 [Flagelloscypha sp. PMI_526]
MDLSKLLNGPGSGGVGTFAGMKTRDPFWPRHANREFEHHTSARRREGRSAPRNDTSSSDLMSSSQKLLGGLNDESLRQPQSSLPSKRPLLVSDSVAHKGHSRMQPEFAVPSRLPEARPPRPSSPFSQNIKAPRLEPRTSAARVPLRTEPDLDCKTHPAKGTNARHVEPPLVIPFGFRNSPRKNGAYRGLRMEKPLACSVEPCPRPGCWGIYVCLD